MDARAADTLATVAAGRTAAVVQLRQLATRRERLPLDAAAEVLVLLEPALAALERLAGLALERARSVIADATAAAPRAARAAASGTRVERPPVLRGTLPSRRASQTGMRHDDDGLHLGDDELHDLGDDELHARACARLAGAEQRVSRAEPSRRTGRGVRL
jgi:hypothetical protein